MARPLLFRRLATAIALPLLAACGKGGDGPTVPVTPPAPTVQSVTVSPATATLTAAGQTTALAAEVRLSNGTLGTQAVSWSSSNGAVASVSGAGVVTAVASGQATIVAAVGSVTGQAAITVAIPTVTSVTVTPATATLVSLGATTSLTAVVGMSNGSTGTQTPTWSSSNPAVATVVNGTVTAVSNGTATISATVGAVVGTAAITVAQAVASVRVLPTDTVIKSSAQLRGAALDARGNVIAGAALQWSAVVPNIVTLSPSGVVQPAATGVARVRVTAGAFTATAVVRSIGNITRLTDLDPLFEYTASAGQRKAWSDVSQSHADARAVIMGQVWSYLETVLPSNGTAVTDMHFTTWHEIWLEASPFCGGVIFPNQSIYQICNSPTWTHWIVPGTSPNDFALIARWLSRQFLLSSMTTAAAFPWFLSGYTQWLAGGAFQGAQLVGAPLAASIADFKTGDAQNLLLPLDSLVRIPNATFFAEPALRTPGAVRQAQSALFVAYLAKDYPTVIPAILARIRATPGAAFTNDLLLQEITTRTGKTLAELTTAYIAYARTL